MRSSAAVASIAATQVEVVLEVRERRQEDVEAAVARLDAQRGAHDRRAARSSAIDAPARAVPSRTTPVAGAAAL